MVASGEISKNVTLVKNTRNTVYSAATNQALPGVQLQFEGEINRHELTVNCILSPIPRAFDYDI